MVVVADQHLGAEFVEPLQARPRLPAAVEQVAGEHQVIDPRAKPRTSQGVLEELGEGVHVRDDQRERCRRLRSVFPRCLLIGHGHHVPATRAAETGAQGAAEMWSDADGGVGDLVIHSAGGSSSSS